jgi:hypothetical protein
MISDKHKRFYIFGEQISPDRQTITSSLGFYEINLPQYLSLYLGDEYLGDYNLPPEIIGKSFEGVLHYIRLERRS